MLPWITSAAISTWGLTLMHQASLSKSPPDNALGIRHFLYLLRGTRKKIIKELVSFRSQIKLEPNRMGMF